jgi:drug/metabolite transporter (DMT)-like permease
MASVLTRSTNRPLAGAAWILVAAAGFASGWVLVRLASETLHPFAIVFWRNAAGLVLLLPLVLRDPVMRDATQWRSHAARATSGILAMLGTFYAVANAPLATVQAINFAAPIFATAGAALFLGERLRARRIGALVIGFAGVLIVLRPGALPLTPGVVAAVIAAVATAFSLIAIKRLVGIAPAMQVVFWSYALPLFPTAIVASFVWSWPEGRAWLYILAIGFATLVGQIATTRAFSVAEATAVMPFDFVRFGMMIAAGVLLFGERVDTTTLAGGAVILASTIYLAYREAVLARRGPASAPPLS